MSAQRESDEARIREHIDTVGEELRARNLDGLKRLYATDVVSFDVDPPLQHVGVEAKLENWARVFAAFQDVTYEFRELTFTVGEDVAFGHGFARLSGTLRDGTTTDGMWVRATYCLRKLDGNWLITHDQVSVPLDVRSGRGVTDLEPVTGPAAELLRSP